MSEEARWLRGVSLLTVGAAAHKVGMFVLKARFGHVAGAEGFGTMNAVLSSTWLVAALSHVGLADHAMVESARDPGGAGRRHGAFLATLPLALLVSLLVLDTVRMVTVGLVVGAVAQHASTGAFLALRGRSRTTFEAVALLVAAVLLVGLGLVARSEEQLASVYVLQGGVFVAIVAVAVRSEPALRPRFEGVAAILRDAAASWPIFVAGTASFALGSCDVLLTERLLGAERAGVLGCATMVVRTGLQVPWLLGAVALGRRRISPSSVALMSLLASLGVAAAAWLSRGWVGSAFGVGIETFEREALRACVLAPVLYVPVAWLPLGLARAPRATMFASLAALTVAVVGALATGGGIAAVQLSQAAGHGVLALGLGWSLASTSGESAE